MADINNEALNKVKDDDIERLNFWRNDEPSSFDITPLYLAPIDKSARIKELEVILRDRDSELEIEYANVIELQATNANLVEQVRVMREALTRIALGNVYDAEIIELAGDTLVSINILGDK